MQASQCCSAELKSLSFALTLIRLRQGHIDDRFDRVALLLGIRRFRA
jgi:hypothetical protein